MLIELIRHGETIWQSEHRYQGISDVPLSEAGKQALCPADFAPRCVYVSPLSRAKETASILFPQAKQIVIEDLREMNFGMFEGKNYQDMEHDSAYRAWVESGCETCCPEGESKSSFSSRVCCAIEQLVDSQRSEERIVIVAHSGTQRAVLERFAIPERSYFEWNCAPGCGFLLSSQTIKGALKFVVQHETCYVHRETL